MQEEKILRQELFVKNDIAYTPKVSVIVPCYNTEQYLYQCMESIINQTLKEIEIICVDDGSTDSSLEILKEYAQKDNRITVLTQKNQYAGVARNNGFDVCSGEYVLFFDSDDYMGLDALEKLYNSAKKSNSEIIICKSSQFFDGDESTMMDISWGIRKEYLNEKNIFIPKSSFKYVFQFCVGWPWDKLYKRSFIERNNIRFQNLRHSNDTFFVLYSLCCADEILTIEENLLFHRKFKSSLSSSREKAPECFYFALQGLEKRLKEEGLFERYEQSFINYVVSFSMWHITTIKNKNAEKKMLKLYKKLVKDLKIKRYPMDYFYNKNLVKQTKKLFSPFRIFASIFSLTNTKDKKHKVITILGIKLKIKRRNKND